MSKISSEIIVAAIAFCGTLFGTLGGILTANRLTNFRIEQLEKKVDEHNNYARRLPVVEEQLRVVNHRLADLENQ